MKLSLMCPSVGGHTLAITSWKDTMRGDWPIITYSHDSGEHAGYLWKVQHFYEEETSADVLGIMHADLILHEEAWDERILAQFIDDDVAVVSFGGSKQHGHKDIYRIPYTYTQLARSAFISNLTDAEVHGERHTGDKDVAVVDSMALFVRRQFLDRIGGWPVRTYPPSHCADYYICLSAHRLGMRVRMVGVSCTHAGGGVGLTKWDYAAWARGTSWGSDAEMHRVGHRLIYDQFRDVLPVVVS